MDLAYIVPPAYNSDRLAEMITAILVLQVLGKVQEQYDKLRVIMHIDPMKCKNKKK